MKTCGGCLKELPLQEFYLRRRAGCRPSVCSWCKTCMRTSARTWRKGNPDRVQAWNKAYYAENRTRERERNRLKQRDSTAKNLRRRSKAPVRWSRSDVLEAYGTLCHLCGEEIDMELKWPNVLSFTVDHVVPLARGGSNDLKNIRPAHGSCNFSKRDRVLECG